MAPHSSTLAWKIHGQRSLVSCSPWGFWGLDKTERLHFHFSLSCIGEGNGNPFQCSCLENPRDRGAWWVAIYGVTQSQTRLTRLSSSFSLFIFTSSIHWGRPSYLTWLLCRTLHSVSYGFLFLLYLLLLFFSQLFLRAPQTTTLPSCISFSLTWFWSLPPVQCYELPSIVLQALCLSDLIPWIH